jgi:hypothetical protein
LLHLRVTILHNYFRKRVQIYGFRMNCVLDGMMVVFNLSTDPFPFRFSVTWTDLRAREIFLARSPSFHFSFSFCRKRIEEHHITSLQPVFHLRGNRFIFDMFQRLKRVLCEIQQTYTYARAYVKTQTMRFKEKYLQ